MRSDLNVKLERVGTLAATGGELERDLALELLREIYAEVKFGVSDAADAEPTAEQVEEPAVEEPIAEPAAEQVEEAAVAEPVAKEIAEPAPVLAHEPEREPEPEPMPIISARVVAPDVIRSLYGSEDDAPATRQEREQEQEPEPVEVAESGLEPVDESETVPETGSGLEPAPLPEPAPQPVSQHTPPQSQTRPVPMPEQPQPAPQRSAPKPEQPVPTATLGDRIGAGHTTLGESLRSGERDMATRAAAAERPGLRRSIGLNDRFLMIRDMFGGDAAAFDTAIERLDAFTDLDEAVIWMRTNFDWSADSPGAEMLVGLLERKLGR